MDILDAGAMGCLRIPGAMYRAPTILSAPTMLSARTMLSVRTGDGASLRIKALLPGWGNSAFGIRSFLEVRLGARTDGADCAS